MTIDEAISIFEKHNTANVSYALNTILMDKNVKNMIYKYFDLISSYIP